MRLKSFKHLTIMTRSLAGYNCCENTFISLVYLFLRDSVHGLAMWLRLPMSEPEHCVWGHRSWPSCCYMPTSGTPAVHPCAKFYVVWRTETIACCTSDALLTEPHFFPMNLFFTPFEKNFWRWGLTV